MSALLNRCARGSSQGPLFVFADGKLLSRSRFVDQLRKGLREAPTTYCSHSFRIGAATTAAKKDCIIKTLEGGKVQHIFSMSVCLEISW